MDKPLLSDDVVKLIKKKLQEHEEFQEKFDNGDLFVPVEVDSDTIYYDIVNGNRRKDWIADEL